LTYYVKLAVIVTAMVFNGNKK